MKAPKTYFSTELHTGRRAIRRRLSDLFAAPRRVGVLPLACILLLVSMLGSLVACDTAPRRRSRRRRVLRLGAVPLLVGELRGSGHGGR